MVSATMLGALAGFLSAFVVLGIPLLGFLLHLDRGMRKLGGLITGRDEIEDDGLIPRLSRVEQRIAEHRVALRESDAIELPDIETEDPNRRAD